MSSPNSVNDDADAVCGPASGSPISHSVCLSSLSAEHGVIY